LPTPPKESIREGSQWTGQRVFITGVCGTVGRQLLQQVLAQGPAEVVGIDNNESELFFLRETYAAWAELTLCLADVRDASAIDRRMHGVDIVLHAAALKHVLLCEESPRDAVQTNVLGVQNVIDAAIHNGVGRVIFTSSDKAVNPTSVMGTSKLMGERLITAAASTPAAARPIFASTRFGNVLGSRGSVIPLFRRQIRAGGPVTLTDRRMTRFIMSLDDAVRLVMESVFLAQGGEVFVTKMPVIRIEDLASAMVSELALASGCAADEIRIEIVGTKAGEKLYEELLNEEEIRRSLELERYFVVLPAVNLTEARARRYPRLLDSPVTAAYNSASQPAMTQAALATFLRSHRLLEDE